MRKFVERHFELVDMTFCLITFVAAVSWANTSKGSASIIALMDGSRAAFYSALVGLFGTLFGFGAASLAIALTFAHSDRLQIVRESRHWRSLWAVFLRAIKTFAVAALWCVCGLIFDSDKHPSAWFLCVTLGLSMFAALKLYRVIWLFDTVVILVTSPKIHLKESEKAEDRAPTFLSH